MCDATWWEWLPLGVWVAVWLGLLGWLSWLELERVCALHYQAGRRAGVAEEQQAQQERVRQCQEAAMHAAGVRR